MSIKKGRELIAEFDSQKIGDVTSIQLTIDGNVINISNWDSGDWNSKLAGRKDWSMTIGLHHNPEDDQGQEDVETALLTSGRSGTINFGPETPDTGDVSYSGDVIISNYQVDASDSDDAITSSLSIEGNNALTRSVAV